MATIKASDTLKWKSYLLCFMEIYGKFGIIALTFALVLLFSL